MLYVGVDLGMDGAIAYINDDPKGIPVGIVSMPTIKVGKRRDYLPENLRLCFLLCKTDFFSNCIVGIEALHAMPSGVCSGVANFSLGRASGLVEATLVGLQVPYQKITPQRWKGLLLDGMPKGKGSSVLVAKRLFPGVDFSRKIDHNKADSLLIAEYLRRTYRPN